MSSGSVSVRQGRPDDERSVLALADQLAAFAVPAWRTAREIQRADDGVLRDALGGAPGTAVFVAEGVNGNDGVVCLTTTVDYFTREPLAHIEVLGGRSSRPGPRGRARADAGGGVVGAGARVQARFAQRVGAERAGPRPV